MKMEKLQLSWLFCLAMLLAFYCDISLAGQLHRKKHKFLSPEVIMEPGLVQNVLFRNVQFPKGHIGIKSVNAEVVDEDGVPVPLEETYIHHWAFFRYYHRIGAEDKAALIAVDINQKTPSDFIPVMNSGVCSAPITGQYFGMSSETRKTSTLLPDPYAIEVGRPEDVPKGYEERWMINFHAFDTRGVVDRFACRDCRCDVYNVTVDESGKPLSPGYRGGFHCCYNQAKCMVKQGFTIPPRKIHLRYTVEWVDGAEPFIPGRIYMLSVTDTGKILPTSTGPKHQCLPEYEIKPCESDADTCTDTKKTSIIMPKGGFVIYAVGNQYPGGKGAALYKKDGSSVCKSMPLYGKGKKLGDEAGYIEGMSACYPQPGSIFLADGESLLLESKYAASPSFSRLNMVAFFKILIADHTPQNSSAVTAAIH